MGVFFRSDEMSKAKSGKFTRTFSQKLQKKLELDEHRELWDKLKNDKDVFPAIRKEEMHFYHKGGRLFGFDNRGFRTNVKYTLVLPAGSKSKGDIFKKDLAEIQTIESFTENYDGMKSLVDRYSKSESNEVSKLYEKWSYRKWSSGDIVVLDIEASFSADGQEVGEDEEDRSQDRIDLVLFDPLGEDASGEKPELLFVEVKLFSNPEIRVKSDRAKPEEGPEVVGQINRYRNQLETRKVEILKAYEEYIREVNKLFGLELPQPKEVIPNVLLLIVGFNEDQNKKDSQLSTIKANLKDVCCLSRGGMQINKNSTLKKWFNHVRKWRAPRDGEI